MLATVQSASRGRVVASGLLARALGGAAPHDLHSVGAVCRRRDAGAGSGPVDQSAHQLVDVRVEKVVSVRAELLAEQVVQAEVAQHAIFLALADALEPAAAAKANQDLHEPEAVPPTGGGRAIHNLSDRFVTKSIYLFNFVCGA